jgi:hypothetical protein
MMAREIFTLAMTAMHSRDISNIDYYFEQLCQSADLYRVHIEGLYGLYALVRIKRAGPKSKQVMSPFVTA